MKTKNYLSKMFFSYMVNATLNNSVMTSPLPLRPNVCIFLLNKQLKLFIAERTDSKGIWQLPQGGHEPNWTEEESVLSELEEETGAQKIHFTIVKKLSASHSYEFSSPPSYALGKWRGQQQSFWLVTFSGTDADFNLSRHTPEFQSWQWIAIDDLGLIVEPQRFIGYQKALPEVKNYITRLSCR